MGVFQKMLAFVSFQTTTSCPRIFEQTFFSFSDPGFAYFAQNTRK